MKIKVCGMREKANIRQLMQLDIDYMGFIFYEGSPRFTSIIPDVDFPKYIKKTGVFVNKGVKDIVSLIRDNKLNAVQLHGDIENVEFLKQLNAYLQENEIGNVEVIKVFRIDQDFDFEQVLEYEDYCDMFLFDTKRKDFGGTGEKFNWKTLSKFRGNKPYMLSGGIGPEDIEVTRDFFNGPLAEKCAGIDLNSGFELKPALKSIEQLEKFINKLR